MKDDRILKPRLRLCPFCGQMGLAELRTSGAVAFVRCARCRCDGPESQIDAYLPDDFHQLSGVEQDIAWSDATIEAQHRAMIAWNGRPWEGSYFPEELEDLEKHAKTHSAALYGKSCSEEVAECGA